MIVNDTVNWLGIDATCIEANLASNAVDFRDGKHPGYMPTAWDGIKQTLELANTKRIKIILNGGALNPKGLAEMTSALVLLRSVFLCYN
jgi:hypothetical protein